MNKSSKILMVAVVFVIVLSISSIVMANNYNELRQNSTDIEEMATAMGESFVIESVGEQEPYSELDSSENTENPVEILSVDDAAVSETAELSISYRVLASNSEWTGWSADGEAAAADKISGLELVLSETESLEVLYSVYDSINGWSGWVSGAESLKLSNPVSALRMTLSGDNAEAYDIYYSICLDGEAWTGWFCNAETAGSLLGENCEITGIKISIVLAGNELKEAADGEISGEGEAAVSKESEAAAPETTAEEESAAEEESRKTAELNTEASETEAPEETETELNTEASETEAPEETAAEPDTVASETELSTEAEPKETVPSDSEEESTDDALENNDEDVSVGSNTETMEGTFHITTAEDDADILLVADEGATYTELTHSSAGSISALYDYPNTYKNIGRSINDLIGVAVTQVGYYRAEYTETKYGIWYGYPKSAWCAMFVSWCADQAGINSKTIKPYCRCATEATWFKSENRWKEPAKYTPQEGDLIFFHYNGSTINHTGIVSGVEDGYVYCIEGNNSDSVNITRHKLTADYIAGYGNPDYNETEESIKYSAHVRSYGWMDYVLEGEQAGTTGESRRMEAIKISLADDLMDEGGIAYRVHVRSYGWMPYVKNGEQAGTTGESRRMEAIEIMLTGDLAEQYDVYYRAHVRSYGWLDWAKNGEMAGTSGMALRLEALEIQLVKKGGEAPGATNTSYLKK